MHLSYIHLFIVSPNTQILCLLSWRHNLWTLASSPCQKWAKQQCKPWIVRERSFNRISQENFKRDLPLAPYQPRKCSCHQRAELMVFVSLFWMCLINEHAPKQNCMSRRTSQSPVGTPTSIKKDFVCRLQRDFEIPTSFSSLLLKNSSSIRKHSRHVVAYIAPVESWLTSIYSHSLLALPVLHKMCENICTL